MKRIIILSIFVTLFSFQLSFADDINELKLKAEKGDSTAQYELAVYYLNNESTNYIDVLRLLRESSKQGNEKAKKKLGDLTSPGYEKWGDFSQELYNSYDNGVLSEEDKEFLKKWGLQGCGSSSCKGHKGYLLVLAHSYFHEGNYPKALEYYKMALTQMKRDNLGEDYDDTPFEVVNAWKDALHMIGYCYENGYGVKQNGNEAITYYLLWINPEIYSYNSVRRKEIVLSFNNNELTEAFEKKGEFDRKPVYDEREFFHESYYWVHRAAYLMLISHQYKELCKFFNIVPAGEEEEWREFPDPVSFLFVGEIYYKGLGTKQNYDRAFWYFEYITDEMPDSYNMNIGIEYRDINNYPSIYADACYRLYECYAHGRGTQKNSKKAEWYFKRALRFGSTSAMYDDQKRYEITEK